MLWQQALLVKQQVQPETSLSGLGRTFTLITSPTDLAAEPVEREFNRFSALLTAVG
jgi:hypothetical protein